MVTQQCPAGPSCWMLDVDPEKPPGERLDLTGRDPATLTEREKLAAAYPEVHALMQELAAAQAEADQVRAWCEQRITDLQTEYDKTDAVRDRQLAKARARVADLESGC